MASQTFKAPKAFRHIFSHSSKSVGLWVAVGRWAVDLSWRLGESAAEMNQQKRALTVSLREEEKGKTLTTPGAAAITETVPSEWQKHQEAAWASWKDGIPSSVEPLPLICLQST